MLKYKEKGRNKRMKKKKKTEDLEFRRTFDFF